MLVQNTQNAVANAHTWQSLLLNESVAMYAQAIATVVAVYLAYRFAIKQSKRETQKQIQCDHNERQANALEAAWGLLQYMTLTENANSILVFERDKDGKDTYYCRLPQAKAFIEEALPQAFYTQHAGLYWPTELKDAVFSYRNQLFGLYLKAQRQHSNADADAQNGQNEAPQRVRIQNPQLVEKCRKSYDTINQLLRNRIPHLYTGDNAVHNSKHNQ